MSNDLICRQAAIDAMCSACGYDCDKSEFAYDAPIDEQVIICPEHYALSTLPSAQPEITHCEFCEHWKNEHLCECLSRYGSFETPKDFFCGYGKERVMDDLISRQDAIDALKMDISIIPFAKAREYVRAAIDTIYNRLEELPSAQPERKKISEEKMKIVIENYFKDECDVNTSIKSAFEKGFRIGVKKGMAL